MKNTKAALITLAILISSISLYATVKIIPQPNNIQMGEGVYKINRKTAVISGENTLNEANFLSAILGKGFGEEGKIKSTGKGIVLRLNASLKNQLGDEGYNLTITADQVIIEGSTAAGVFYGIQTFRQLLPANFEFTPSKKQEVLIPVLKITDKPRFVHREFLFDEARHFKGMHEVKRLLDQMALIKMNVFHWHLTDDQGWRLEIKKYPKLTEVGAFRKDTQAEKKSPKRTGKPHGGFYTQEQIKELINYATERHIKVVPEIEMPGHASAAIASYPWLGTNSTLTEVPVVFGKLEDCFNVADPKVYQFIEDVLTEVFELFPSKEIHIGGDEVKFGAWKNSEYVQAMMKKEGLKTPADLQIFFTNKISNFIHKNGRRMIGFNEILGGNVHAWREAEDVDVKEKLAPSVIINFWKGSFDLMKEALSGGYEIINSEHIHTYLDYPYEVIPLKKAYAFNPIPEELDKKYHHQVLGSGCSMWSEWIPTIQGMHKQIFPRLAAYAEVGWTQTSEKDFERFTKSLKDLKIRWNFLGISFTEEPDKN